MSKLAGAVPAIRLSTVLAACGPSCEADAQHMRSGWPDGAAQSPAATMRRSSTLVSVSSVSSRPIASVRSPLAAARSGTPKPAVQTVIALGRTAPSSKTTASGRTSVTTSASSTATRSLASTLATDRRPGTDSVGPNRPPQTRVTLRPCSASSVAASIPVSPAPTTVTGASGCTSSRAARRRCACSSSAMG